MIVARSSPNSRSSAVATEIVETDNFPSFFFCHAVPSHALVARFRFVFGEQLVLVAALRGNPLANPRCARSTTRCVRASCVHARHSFGQTSTGCCAKAKREEFDARRTMHLPSPPHAIHSHREQRKRALPEPMQSLFASRWASLPGCRAQFTAMLLLICGQRAWMAAARPV